MLPQLAHIKGRETSGKVHKYEHELKSNFKIELLQTPDKACSIYIFSLFFEMI